MSKVACTIVIQQVRGEDVTYLVCRPDTNKCIGGGVKKGGTITIYQHEIAKE